MTVGPIPYSAIMKMADDFQIHGHPREVFLHVIRGLDNAQLKQIREQNEKTMKAK